MSAFGKLVVLIVALLCSFPAETGSCFQATAKSAPDDGARFRVARAISGSRGSQERGRFVMEDPRSVFYVPQDRQVIVYCEIEGPTGMHRIEGFWKNPSGKVATISDFIYESKERRFSAYWTLALAESAETGTWALEAHVDGEYVGAFTFQIVAGIAPADAAPKKKLLGASETYQRALASTVTIEKLSKNGDRLGVRSGFVISPTVVLSSFQAVDGVSKTRILFPDGRAIESDQMLAWNRAQDWVAIKIDAGQTPALPSAKPNSWDVGDHVAYLEISPEGNRVLSEVKIVGKNAFPSAGERLNLSHMATDNANGSPLLNDYGEVVGILGGSTGAGNEPINFGQLQSGTFRIGNPMSGAMAVPINLVDLQKTSPTDMEFLIRSGESLPPLVANKYLAYLKMTHGISRLSGTPWPIDSSARFSQSDGKLFVYSMWDSKTQMKASAKIQIYTRDNKMYVPSSGPIKEAKVNLKPGKNAPAYWQLNSKDMTAGIYRVEVFFNNELAGRVFFQIAD